MYIHRRSHHHRRWSEDMTRRNQPLVSDDDCQNELNLLDPEYPVEFDSQTGILYECSIQISI